MLSEQRSALYSDCLLRPLHTHLLLLLGLLASTATAAAPPLGTYRCTSWHIHMSAPAPYPDLTLGGKGFKFTYDAAHNTFRFTSGPLAGTTGDVLVVDGKPALSFNTNTDNIECKPK